MEYTIIVDGKGYELPKKTVAVMTALDGVMKVDTDIGLSVRQKFEKLHTFMKDTVGSEKCEEMFGSDKLEEIDLSELTLAVRKVIDAYDKPIADYDREKTMSKFNDIPIEKVVSLTKAANTMTSFSNK
ncbi:MAG: hypothetical protein IJP31_04580 [Lachnospiraceae bacterium]|nr:hypothetical protein [Lachnospiraceae bacterium]